MKVLIIYDSQFGNTEKIAKAIASGFSGNDSVKSVNVSKTNYSDFKSCDLMIIGSPTQGGRPTQALQLFLNQIPPGTIKGIKVASFDTRFLAKDLKFPLNWLINKFGYAAPRIAKAMEGMDGIPVGKPEGFIVKGKEGPLKSGEIERAKTWGKGLSRRN